jgi:hypothetical protein
MLLPYYSLQSQSLVTRLDTCNNNIIKQQTSAEAEQTEGIYTLHVGPNSMV